MRNLTIASLTVGALLLAAAGNASAHKTVYSPDNKIRFTYGHLNEAIYTYQKTGLDLTLRDNATSATLPGFEMPTDGRAPKLYVSYRYGAEGGPELNITTKFVGQHGSPGKYTYPVMFTQAGSYSLLIKGVINGTYYDMVIPPAHEVASTGEIMWPQEVSLPDEQATELAALKAEVAELKTKVDDEPKRDTGAKAPAVGLASLLALGAIALVVARRR